MPSRCSGNCQHIWVESADSIESHRWLANGAPMRYRSARLLNRRDELPHKICNRLTYTEISILEQLHECMKEDSSALFTNRTKPEP